MTATLPTDQIITTECIPTEDSIREPGKFVTEARLAAGSEHVTLYFFVTGADVLDLDEVKKQLTDEHGQSRPPENGKIRMHLPAVAKLVMTPAFASQLAMSLIQHVGLIQQQQMAAQLKKGQGAH
jgi:hypothetical protein